MLYMIVLFPGYINYMSPMFFQAYIQKGIQNLIGVIPILQKDGKF